MSRTLIATAPKALVTLIAPALILLGGCAGAGSVPGADRAAQTAVRAPSESAMGLPGESAMGLPGESAMGLPGAQFGCTGVPAPGGAACTIAINTNVSANPNPSASREQLLGLQPADLQNAYGLPAQNPGGVVAIVDAYDDPAAEADLAVYRAAFGLPPCSAQSGCLRKVNQTGQAGAYPAADRGWAAEIALDLDMVSAACPRCSILLVEANSAQIDDLGAAVDTAARLGARAISNSYYAVEWSGETSEDVHYQHRGVAITASSGDRGYPAYPAASRDVTAVGGTSLSGGAGGWTETAWQYAGHGCSADEPKPDWQSAASCRTRSAVDLAVVADPQTGVAAFASASGGWVVAGGTSVGAPLVAAAYALAANPQGPSFSYRHASAFRPVGGAGYTLAAGLGTPIGVGGL